LQLIIEDLQLLIIRQRISSVTDYFMIQMS